MKRNNLALQRRTKISQKLPEQTQELLEKFYEHITRLKSLKFFELDNILNILKMKHPFELIWLVTLLSI